jgi:hypothetical protein
LPSDIHASSVADDGIGNSFDACIDADNRHRYNFIFSLVEEAMIGDPVYLVAVIIEFLRSATIEKLKVPSNLYAMIIRFLSYSDHYAKLGMLITNKILEPSREVALQLIGTGHIGKLKS